MSARALPSPADAERFIADASFVWHQKFELVPGVTTPGGNDIARLLDRAGVPADLTGMSVLDIGTSNGGVSFLLERRGAARVVAVDIASPDWFGFEQLRTFLGSGAVFVQGNIYDLPGVLAEEFDVVLFFGVLYHLRHPLLALDNLRMLTRGEAFIETHVSDHELGDLAERPLVRFYRKDELGEDGSNWFAPTTAALIEWCESAGFSPELMGTWPNPARRATIRARRTAGDPEFVRLSYERPLTVQAHSSIG